MKQNQTTFQPLLPIIASLTIIVGVSFWFIFRFSDQKLTFPDLGKNAGHYLIAVPQQIFYHQPFKATITLDTNGKMVNAIGLTLNYDNQKLRVVNMDTTQSFCQFYPEKKFNDNLGYIKLSCGSPSPGFSGESQVAVIEFMPIKIGTTDLIIDPASQILLSDGKGTDILQDYPKEALTIINSL